MRQVNCKVMRRSLLVALLLASAVYLSLLLSRSVPLPLPDVAVTFHTPYQAEPLLAEYDRLFHASLRNDTQVLQRYVQTASGGFLLYRTLLELARDPDLPAAVRLGYFERVSAFELISPLARDDVRRAQLEIAGVAEAAGNKARAVLAYQNALPLETAAAGLKRLEPNPRALARIFLAAREPERALTALKNTPAPAIRAPAYAALGDHERALGAYNRWLRRSPGSVPARQGKVAVLSALARYDQAEALLQTLPEDLTTEAALAEAQGNVDAAVSAYLGTGGSADSWQATGLLEESERTADALPLYLNLARSTTDYQDDAAYRAYVLAQRLNDETTAAEANALIPPFSYFGLLRGGTVELPGEPLARVTPPALKRARALARTGDHEAALGELLVAIKRASDEATTIALAEALQGLGEYGASTEAASQWLEGGSRARRTWLAAYPRAYRETVETQAARRGLEPTFIWAIMRQESLFYPRAVSTSQARGVMQIVPDTWNWLAELLEEPAADPFRVHDNVRYGTFYVSQLLTMFEGDLPRSAAAYNGGPGYVQSILEGSLVTTKADFYRFISREETREYVQRVMLNHAVYTALYQKR